MQIKRRKDGSFVTLFHSVEKKVKKTLPDPSFTMEMQKNAEKKREQWPLSPFLTLQYHSHIFVFYLISHLLYPLQEKLFQPYGNSFIYQSLIDKKKIVYYVFLYIPNNTLILTECTIDMLNNSRCIK